MTEPRVEIRLSDIDDLLADVRELAAMLEELSAGDG